MRYYAEWPLHCEICGRVVELNDLLSGKAVRRLVTPDSHWSGEKWETLCPDHTKEDAERER